MTIPNPHGYDAVLLVSFGGPEGMDEVIPFLENVLRGRNVPRERLEEVAEHYRHFDGVSPLNAQNRALIAALKTELATDGPDLSIYWGNRNWHPLLPDTMRQMAADGIKRALAIFTSAYSSYSGCRQYRENIAAAQAEVGEAAPQVDKIRHFFNHPGFIEPSISLTGEALAQIPAERRQATQIIFTAHSIPSTMAATCDYEAQLREVAHLVAEGLDHANWTLVYQSRSGPPHQPWLAPDICDYLRQTHAEGVTDVVIAPIGFLSDHMEVLFDLDTEAREVADELGLTMVRADTVGTHPKFIRMLRDLIVERMADAPDKIALGTLGPSHDICPADCCPPPKRPARPGR